MNNNLKIFNVTNRVDPILDSLYCQPAGVGKVELIAGTGGASLLYCEGQPINEPVARMGPFVMNTETELMQAVEDYNSGRLAT